MSTFTFFGKVLPERDNLRIPMITEVKIEAREAGIKFDATISISASQVFVVLRNVEGSGDIITLKNYAEYLVRTIIDAQGYISAKGYDVEIVSFADSNGKTGVFDVGVLHKDLEENKRPLHFHEVTIIVWQSPHLRRALADLRESIRSPVDTGFFCFRAIESIRQYFVKAEDGKETAPSWERLRTTLRIDRSYFAKVQTFAEPQRHGETPYTSGEDRIDLMRHAWQVVDRFCLYLLRGRQQLPDTEFDLLKC
jgi:hypothetical protein